ncbi:MAG: TerC family protein [Verrucomicrobia bacterium]|nr:TerC family protein [Verrucomicrobiota bacterium]
MTSAASFDWVTDPESWIAFAALLAMEIVLGIDNVVFISILADKLSAQSGQRARTIGLGLAMVSRILLLLCVTWLSHLAKPLFAVSNHTVSGRDLVLLAGGLFLLAKSCIEIHRRVSGEPEEKGAAPGVSFSGVIIQILLLDLVFSLDSVITAVGMVDQISLMILAVILATITMIVFAHGISTFIERYPTFKMLALSFLVLIGVMLIAEGLHQHISKGYIYFAMVFSIAVEFLNLRRRRKSGLPPG